MRYLLLLLVLVGVAGAAERVRYVRAGWLIDPASGRVSRDRLIAIEDGCIASVTKWREPDGPYTDWSRRWVLPGLVDMHTHLADFGQTGDPLEPLKHPAAELAAKGRENASRTLEAGFTTVHDVGSYRAFADVLLRDAIAAGQVRGPRMNVVGAYLTCPGGGGEVTGAPPVGVTIAPEFRFGVLKGGLQAAQRAKAILDGGADSLKAIATGAVLTEGTEPGQLELTETELRAAVLQAEKRGTYVTAHAHGAEGIKAAIRAGVRSIEHASLIDEEGLALAKDRGVWLVMDIYNGDFIDTYGRAHGWPPSHLRKNLETTEAQRVAFRKAVRAGVKLAFGTDAGVFPHGTNAKQFRYMVRWGMTPLQAIRSATSEAADLLGRTDIGRVSPGAHADLIALDGDPLADVTVLEHVGGVIQGGVPVR